MWEFWKRIRDHDPIADCLALRCPHLAIFGSADQIVPVEESVAAFAAAACNPSRCPAATTTIHVVPGANHRLLTGKGTAPSRQFLVNLSTWITAATASGEP